MQFKTCSKCQTSKPTADFSKRSAAKDGLQAWCKQCQKETDALRWENRSAGHNEKRRERRKRNMAYIKNYLASHPCVDCGEDDVIVLDLDHVSGVKRIEVSCMGGHSLSTIQEEIDKCEVRCANCHRRITHKRRILNTDLS